MTEGLVAEAEVFDDPDRLPHDLDALFAQTPFQSGRAWWRCAVDHASPPGSAPRLLLWREAGRPAVLLPLRGGPDGLTSLSTPYTTLWCPPMEAGLDSAAVVRAGAGFGRACRRWPLLRLEALDAAWPPLDSLLRGFRCANYRAMRFDHFGNWHEPTQNLDWRAYMAGRPGALRETIRRKQARADRNTALGFRESRSPAEVEAEIPAYLDVYRRSWKQPEPFPDFDSALLRAAAARGAVRLAVLRQGEVPVAAQYWIVERGVASVLKLAHDEAFRALSPGTLLTAWMIRRLLDAEHVTALDFGRGDDPYKRSWAGQRRQRIGVILANPWSARGMAALARQQASRAAGAWRRR